MGDLRGVRPHHRGRPGSSVTGGSPAGAGPYANGTKITLIQAPGATPNVKPGPGDIDWHVTLKGDAVVIATDDSGNSARVSCRVPPPPK